MISNSVSFSLSLFNKGKQQYDKTVQKSNKNMGGGEEIFCVPLKESETSKQKKTAVHIS